MAKTTEKRYTGITAIDTWLNGGESPLSAKVSLDLSSLIVPVAIAVAGALVVVLASRKGGRKK